MTQELNQIGIYVVISAASAALLGFCAGLLVGWGYI